VPAGGLATRARAALGTLSRAARARSLILPRANGGGGSHEVRWGVCDMRLKTTSMFCGRIAAGAPPTAQTP
jgi:hypothetical protein